MVPSFSNPLDNAKEFVLAELSGGFNVDGDDFKSTADAVGCECRPTGPHCGEEACSGDANYFICECRPTGSHCGNEACIGGANYFICECPHTGPYCGNEACRGEEATEDKTMREGGDTTFTSHITEDEELHCHVIDSEEIRQNRVPDKEDDSASWISGEGGEGGEDVAEKDLVDLKDVKDDGTASVVVTNEDANILGCTSVKGPATGHCWVTIRMARQASESS